MTLKKMRGVLAILFSLILLSSPVIAANNQTVVIGFGMGPFDFKDDDLGKIDNILYGSEYAEWYLLDEIGLGIRTHKFYKTGSSDSSEELLMANVNLTLTWILFGSSSEFRMAAYIGYGPGGVSYKNSSAGIDVTASADTKSGGLFMDWGGETWGARLGYHMVAASFDFEEGPVSGTIDGSGNSFDLGFRIAF